MPRLWKGLGLVTGALFLLLGILLFVAPLVFPYIGGLLGENARKAPLLAEKISLGYQPFFAGMMIIAGGALLIFSTRKGNVTAIFGGLLGAALLLNAAVVLFIQPVYDRLADRPLIHMAVEAAKIVPEDKRILLYKIHQRPSVNFYSDRNSIRLSSRQVEEMPALFHSGEVLAGITTSYQFGKLKEAGLEPQKLAEDTGFILFNLPEKKVEPAAPAEPAMVEEKGVQQEGADVQPEKPSEQERGQNHCPSRVRINTDGGRTTGFTVPFNRIFLYGSNHLFPVCGTADSAGFSGTFRAFFFPGDPVYYPDDGPSGDRPAVVWCSPGPLFGEADPALGPYAAGCS